MKHRKNTPTDLVVGLVLAASCVTEHAALAIEQAADFAADIVEGLGSIVEDFLVAVAHEDELKDIRWIKPVLRYAGRCACGWFFLGSAIIKSGTAIATGQIRGWTAIALGLFSLDPKRVRGGVAAIAAGIVGAVALYVGCLVSFVQTCSWALQPRHRALTAKERKVLELVFRRSLAMPNVRVVEGYAGLFSALAGKGHDAFCLGDIIIANDTALPIDQLVRACIGVWRFQHYGAGCLGERVLAHAADDGWQKEIESGGKHDWMELSEAAKACFHKDVFDYGELLNGNGGAGGAEQDHDDNKTGNGAFYGVDRAGPSSKNRFVRQGKDYTEFGNNSVKTLRQMVSRRISAGWNPKPPSL